MKKAILISVLALGTSLAFGEEPLHQIMPRAEHIELITPKEYKPIKNLYFEVKEKVYNPAKGENTPWAHVATKTISYPLIKVQYETVQYFTSIVTETVRRSPWDNALGTVDEAKQTLKLIKNGIFDVFRGLFNPKNGAVIDGFLGIGSGVLNSLDVASGAVKTVGSVVAYPTYRVLGGNKSQRASLKGKRAAIVFVDTGMYPINYFLDPYGDQIVRHHLNGVVDYYCVVSDLEGSSRNCLDHIPYNTEFVDMVTLTHSGGTSIMDSRVDQIVAMGFKPGLMLSIGCNDNDSTSTVAANAMGQDGYSWAVHFYLSSAIAKRIRGIPMDQAAKEAFYENLPVNFVNPVSIAGQAVVGLGLGDSIYGSYPDVRGEDTQKTIDEISKRNNVAKTIRVLKYAKLFNEGSISVNEFGKLMSAYEVDKMILLAEAKHLQDTKKILANSWYGNPYEKIDLDGLVHNFERTTMPKKVTYYVKFAGGKGKARRTKYIL